MGCMDPAASPGEKDGGAYIQGAWALGILDTVEWIPCSLSTSSLERLQLLLLEASMGASIVHMSRSPSPAEEGTHFILSSHFIRMERHVGAVRLALPRRVQQEDKIARRCALGLDDGIRGFPRCNNSLASLFFPRFYIFQGKLQR